MQAGSGPRPGVLTLMCRTSAALTTTRMMQQVGIGSDGVTALSMTASLKCGWHRARTPGWLIVVEFSFSLNDSFVCSLLPPLPLPIVAHSMGGMAVS